MGNIVLKGGVSFNKYVWRTSVGACEACQELDGTEYDYEGDIPAPPHPNCMCWIDVIENDENNSTNKSGGNNDEEPCDCCQVADMLEENIGDAESLIDELEQEIINTEHIISEIENQTDINNICDPLFDNIEKLNDIVKTIGIFISNFLELLEIEDGNCDKYYHAKANCEAAQLGVTGEETAKILSDYKEGFDTGVKAILDSIKLRTDYRETLRNKVKDSQEDQNANKEGREKGRNNPKDSCDDMLRHRLPPYRR